MTGREAYNIWAPAGKKWVDWVRPVPFVSVDEYSKLYSISPMAIPKIKFLSDGENVHNKSERPYADAAVIVDLPGAESVREGIALANEGYRPISVFNGTIEQQGARATVDNQSVGMELLWAAEVLKGIHISDDAMPAFLLDSNRLQRFKMEVSLFDNSWDIYPQDIPSPEYMLDNGVHRIIVVGDSVSKDLKKILYAYQKKNIEIMHTRGYEAPKRINIRKPLLKSND